MPRRFAASTRAWPAMIPLAPSRRMGLVQPNSLRDAAIWPTWESECVRAFRAYGSSSATGLYLTFSGLGQAFTKSTVASLGHKNDIPVCPIKEVRDGGDGPFTADEAARELGVSMHTVHRWLREGVLAGEQAMPYAPWRILLPEDVRRCLAGGAVPDGWVGLDEAARRLGISKSLVAHWVKQGESVDTHHLTIPYVRLQ